MLTFISSIIPLLIPLIPLLFPFPLLLPLASPLTLSTLSNSTVIIPTDFTLRNMFLSNTARLDSCLKFIAVMCWSPHFAIESLFFGLAAVSLHFLGSEFGDFAGRDGRRGGMERSSAFSGLERVGSFSFDFGGVFGSLSSLVAFFGWHGWEGCLKLYK
jgi:hypothetical protein